MRKIIENESFFPVYKSRIVHQKYTNEQKSDAGFFFEKSHNCTSLFDKILKKNFYICS